MTLCMGVGGNSDVSIVEIIIVIAIIAVIDVFSRSQVYKECL